MTEVVGADGKPVVRNLKSYVEKVDKYIDAAVELAGKPQKLSIVGDHLYWTQGKKQELFRVSTKDPSATGERVIVTDSNADPSADGKGKLTKEEELLRERTRSLVTGISSYHVRPNDGAVFFVSGVDLFVYYQEGPRARQAPIKVFDSLSDEDKAHFAEQGDRPNMYVQFTTKAATAEDPSTIDFTRLTFVNNNNVYLAQLKEHPAEADANGGAAFDIALTQITHIGDDQHQCGVADYIVQEEFDRYTGTYANARYVVYSYTDMSMMRHVALLKGSGDGDDDDGTERMAYSRVGDPNARATIVVYDTEEKKYVYVPSSALEAAAQQSAASFSNVEYIPRFGFKGADALYLSLLSRTQEEMAVVSCKIADLPDITEASLQHMYDNGNKENTEEPAAAGASTASVPFKEEWSQKIPWAWVDVMPGAPILFGSTFDFITCAALETEKAHYHIFYRPAGADATAWRPLTSGEWNVRAGSVRVHPDNRLVSFIANADGRLQYTLYSVSMPTGDFADAVTAPVSGDEYLIRHSGAQDHVYGSYCHDDDSVYFVASSKHRPAEILCAGLTNSHDFRTVAAEPWLKRPTTADTPAEAEEPFHMADDRQSFSLFGCHMTVPSLITVTNRRGVPLSAHLFPAANAPEGPRPLVLFVYGGPHVQLVNESDFDTNTRATVQALAHHGMHVAVVDNSQATCNPLRELAICKKNMGHFETDDYRDVVAALTGQSSGGVTEGALPERWSVDVARVAIFGWSYGGYATLLAMSQAADVFKMGFAGAPVGDWKLYDTGYTERYMGLLHEGDGEKPTVSPQYENSTIGNFVDGFPDELNRVFIAHGLLDENVHFLHTAHVVEAMITAGKPYSVLVYPGERHGLRQKKASRRHHEAMLLKTFVELL